MDQESLELQIALIQANLVQAAARKAVDDKNYAKQRAQVVAQLARMQADLAALLAPPPAEEGQV